MGAALIRNTTERLGIVAFASKTGLGYQTRSLAYMLRPDRIMLLDLSTLNNMDIHADWYDGFDVTTVQGFPRNRDMRKFLEGLDAVIICETPLNWNLMGLARAMQVKVVLQPNWEFFEYNKNPSIAKPHVFAMPSSWHFNDVRHTKVLLPPPTLPEEFKFAREANTGRKGAFVHIAGNPAQHDRNGTEIAVEAASRAGVQLVVYSQKPLTIDYDPTYVQVKVGPDDRAMLYAGYDALIIPRRYGGLCLPMNEALLSALPVVMPNISPNNDVLPSRWLVDANLSGHFITRSRIDIYEADIDDLVAKMLWLQSMTSKELEAERAYAFDLGMQFAPSTLKSKWNEVLWG